MRAIRDYVNFIILSNENSKNLRAVQDTFVGGDMPFHELRRFFSECAPQPYAFVVITLAAKVFEVTYRFGFNRFYNSIAYISTHDISDIYARCDKGFVKTRLRCGD